MNGEAGTYEFHEEHGHFHHAGFSRPELFLVTDPDRGTLEPAGDSRKIGFCTGDYLIAQWNSFANDQGPMEFGLRCARDPMEESVVALTPGWADVYAFYLIDNYVEFGENSDGLYVLRVRANDRDLIHETTTADNYSYALIEVVASTGAIAVRERGYGTDPWDPQKQIADDTRYALAGTSFDGGSPRQGGAPLAIANFAFGNASASGAPSAGAREQIVRALPPVTGSSTFLALSSVPTRPATITIYDTSGRVVRSIGVAAGAEGATWDGRGANGSPVGSGLYFARFSDAATRAIARIVVTR